MAGLNGESTREQWRDRCALTVLAAAILLAIVDVVAGGRSFFIRDISRFYHPTKRIIREILLSGGFPWWNPFYSAGQPLAANPEYAVFYPPQLLILLPDFELGFRFHIAFHLVAAAFGMYLLLRSLRLGRGASVAGALSWGMGGLMMSLVNLLPILFCATWLPYLLRYLTSYVRTGARRHACIAVLFGGLQLLAAEPVTLIQTWVLAGLWLTWFLWRRRRLLAPQLISLVVARFSVVLIGAVLVGAIQLWPAIDHVSDTVRADGFDYDLVTSWSLHPLRPLEMIVPSAFGRFNLDGHVLYWAGGRFYPRQASPFLFSIAPGMIIALMAMVGVVLRFPGWLRYLGTSALFYLLTLGSFTPLYWWAWQAEIGRGFRYPEKFSIGLVFATIVFGAMLLDRLSGNDEKVRKVATALALAIAAGVTVLAALSLHPGYTSMFGDLFGVSESRYLTRMVEGSREVWTLVALLWGAILVTLTVARRRALVILNVILWIELALLGLDVSPRISSEFYRAPPLAAELAPGRDGYRIFHEVDWYGRSKTARSWFSTGDAVYWVVRNGMFPMTPANDLYRTVLERDYDKTAMKHSVDLVHTMFEVRDRGRKDWASIFMSMSNARYRSRYRSSVAVVGTSKREVDPIRMVDEGERPRYSIATGVRRVDDLAELVDTIVEEGSEPGTAWIIGTDSSGGVAGSSGSVELIEEIFSGADLRVNASSPAVLVSSITFHPNWRISVNEEEVEHFPVNVAYTGVVVPEGRSVVRIRYFDPVVAVSAIISCVSVLIVVGILLFPGRRS